MAKLNQQSILLQPVQIDDRLWNECTWIIGKTQSINKMPKSITTFQSSKQLHNSTMLSLRYEITIKYQYYLDIQTRQHDNVLKLIICLTFTVSIRVLCISIKIYWKFVEECTHIRQHFFCLLRIVTSSYLVFIDFSFITRLGCCLSNIILKSYFLTFTQVD